MLLHGMRLPGSMVIGLHLKCREEWSGGNTSIHNDEATRTGVQVAVGLAGKICCDSEVIHRFLRVLHSVPSFAHIALVLVRVSGAAALMSTNHKIPEVPSYFEISQFMPCAGIITV